VLGETVDEALHAERIVRPPGGVVRGCTDRVLTSAHTLDWRSRNSQPTTFAAHNPRRARSAIGSSLTRTTISAPGHWLTTLQKRSLALPGSEAHVSCLRGWAGRTQLVDELLEASHSPDWEGEVLLNTALRLQQLGATPQSAPGN
jgi:hypothetical protein